MIRAFFHGGPMDGRIMALPHAMLYFEVERPTPFDFISMVYGSADRAETQKGRYVLVPWEKDPTWRMGRRYEWEGWK